MNKHKTLATALTALAVAALLFPLEVSAGGGGHHGGGRGRDPMGEATNKFEPHKMGGIEAASGNSRNKVVTPAAGLHKEQVGGVDTVKNPPNVGSPPPGGWHTEQLGGVDKGQTPTKQGGGSPGGLHMEQVGGVDTGKSPTNPGGAPPGGWHTEQVGGVDRGGGDSGYSPWNTGSGGGAGGSEATYGETPTGNGGYGAVGAPPAADQSTGLGQASNTNSEETGKETARIKSPRPSPPSKSVARKTAPERKRLARKAPEKGVKASVSSHGDGVVTTRDSCFTRNYDTFSSKGLTERDATMLATIHCF